MGLKKLIKKAGKFAKKAIKVAAPVLIAGLAPGAAPLITAGASPILGGGGLLGGGGAKSAGQFSPQSSLSGLFGSALAGLQTKAECAITGACGPKGTAAAPPATVAVQSQAAPGIPPLVLLAGLALVAFLIVRK